MAAPPVPRRPSNGTGAASDHGKVEASYLEAAAAFAGDTGVDHLAVREPQIPSIAHFGAEPPVDGFGLDGLFPVGPTGFHDGVEVPLDSVDAGEDTPLCTAVMPDNDGVPRARWRTEPTPSDRDWALRQ
ncbi:hypothetical protein RB200_35270 [Streptomyces sp. PmtG]